MRRLTRLAITTVGLLSLFAIASTSASAITWHNSGDTTFSATAGGPSYSVTSVSLNCASAQMAGTVPTVTVGATLTMSGTGSYLGCTFSGSTINIECGYKFTGVAQHGDTVTGSTDVTCNYYLATTRICHVAGSRPSTYQSPSGSLTGVLTLSTSNLVINNGDVSCMFGNNDTIEFSPQVFNLNAPTGGPRFTRTT